MGPERGKQVSLAPDRRGEGAKGSSSFVQRPLEVLGGDIRLVWNPSR